ncbi:MAG: phenylalanine--tRNA ligase subunit alpha [Candidatus Bathyarchaeia archaeon]
MNATEDELRLLNALAERGGKGLLTEMVVTTGLNHAAAMRAALNLSQKGCLKLEKLLFTVFRLTEEGRQYAEDGLPERRVVETVSRLGGKAPLKEVAELVGVDERLIPAVLGWVKRKRIGAIEKIGGEIYVESVGVSEEDKDQTMLIVLKTRGQLFEKDLSPGEIQIIENLKKRNLVLEERKTDWALTLTRQGFNAARGMVETVGEQTQLTPEDIATGRWMKIKLKKYNIQAPVTLTWPGKKHPYTQFLEEVRYRMLALGFKEMEGPIVELMFFNCDALFMPQDHPAREIHDIFFVKEPREGDLKGLEDVLENVKKTHENGWVTGSKGWGYGFSIQQSKRMVLRSHGTAISARTLVSPKLEIPGKYFSIARCYRPEVTDRTHLTEFNQVEGIVVDEGLTLRDLLGVLERFALEIAGADKVRFKPDYFPFTEPSVELQAYKEGYGWMEFGGSGIFRPELTKPLGVECPVIAWGLGVDRLYMMKHNLDDIREIFTRNISWLRGKAVM